MTILCWISARLTSFVTPQACCLVNVDDGQVSPPEDLPVFPGTAGLVMKLNALVKVRRFGGGGGTYNAQLKLKVVLLFRRAATAVAASIFSKPAAAKVEL